MVFYYIEVAAGMFCKNRCSQKFSKILRKHLCQRPATILMSAALLKERHKCFPANFAKLLRTPYYRTPAMAASELCCTRRFIFS